MKKDRARVFQMFLRSSPGATLYFLYLREATVFGRCVGYAEQEGYFTAKANLRGEIVLFLVPTMTGYQQSRGPEDMDDLLIKAAKRKLTSQARDQINLVDAYPV